jgi:hypothetical protein
MQGCPRGGGTPRQDLIPTKRKRQLSGGCPSALCRNGQLCPYGRPTTGTDCTIGMNSGRLMSTWSPCRILARRPIPLVSPHLEVGLRPFRQEDAPCGPNRRPRSVITPPALERNKVRQNAMLREVASTPVHQTACSDIRRHPVRRRLSLALTIAPSLLVLKLDTVTWLCGCQLRFRPGRSQFRRNPWSRCRRVRW